MSPTRRALTESAVVALGCYVLAAALEALVIRWMRPTEWELASVSDVALAMALGVAVYLWRHLLTTRRELAERERAALVLQTELSLAAEIQRQLLPVLPPSNGQFECAAALKPAGKIGGDLYDLFETDPGVWTVLVADVSGKGIPAALALGFLRSTFRAQAQQRLEPAHIAALMSAAFLQEWRAALYTTCIIARFDLNAGTLTYTNAGHPRGILMGSEGVRQLDRGGPPLGLLRDVEFDQEMLPMHAGDTCLFVTDGVTEALVSPRALEDFGAADAAPLDAGALCEAVMSRALEGPGPPGDPDWDDDRTVVVVRMGVNGPEPARVTVDRPSSAIPSLSTRDETAAGRGGVLAPAAPQPS